MNNKGYTQVYNMYTWLIEKAKEDCDKIKDKEEYKLFHMEYDKAVELLVSKREKLKGNNKLLGFNGKSTQRIVSIVNITKKEYSLVHNENPDIEQINSMLGWYESIDEEINMSIESLFEKQ